MRFGYTWTPSALAYWMQRLSLTQKGLLRDMQDALITNPELPNPTGIDDRDTLSKLAFEFDIPLEELTLLWDERVQLCWEHIVPYMAEELGSKEEFKEKQILAGLASGEAGKETVSMDTAQEVLGESYGVYEALITHWNKKVTAQDCETIQKLIEAKKVTADELISAIIEAKKQAEQIGKVEYMVAVATWLKAGKWKAAKTQNGKPDKLAGGQEEAEAQRESVCRRRQLDGLPQADPEV